MLPIVEKWVIDTAVMFALRQIKKFGDQTDWTKVRADFEKRAADLAPGEWFDDEAKKIADAAIDGVRAMLADVGDVESILKALASSDWAGALEAVKHLVAHVWQPVEPAHQKFAAVVKAQFKAA